MKASPINPSGALLPPKFWLFVGLVTAPVFYLILRSAYKPPSLTPGETAFICVYSLFCTFNWIFASSRQMWIRSHLPNWLKLYWVRFPLYLGLVLVLAGLLNLIKLPTFYNAILGKSIIFLLLPYALTYPRNPKTSFANQALLNSISSHGNNDITLRMRPSKGFFLLATSIAFVAAGIFMLRENQALSWIVICFFGLGIPIGILMLWTGGYSLILSRDGFTMVMLWRRFSCRWADVDDFTVIDTPQGPRVGLNFSENVSESSPAWRKRIASRQWLKETYGRNGILPDNYGIAPDELCRLLVERRKRAMANTSA